MTYDIVVILIVAALIFYKFGEMVYIRIKGGSYANINVAELREYLKTHKQNVDYLMVDVRTAVELKIGKIGGSINIPYNEVKPTEPRLARFKGKPIILYDESGSRSKKVAVKLAKNGYKNLYILNGGYKVWRGEASI